VGKYGEAAIKAVNLIKEDINLDNPITAWDIVTKEIFGVGTPSQVKVCPRNTFLGLCEAGLIQGISKGTYTKSKKNKAYGLKAISLIESDISLLINQRSLWELTTGNNTKVHNSQMDVVVSLWNKQLIKR
jgi:hypothetical protein